MYTDLGLLILAIILLFILLFVACSKRKRSTEQQAGVGNNEKAAVYGTSYAPDFNGSEDPQQQQPYAQQVMAAPGADVGTPLTSYNKL